MVPVWSQRPQELCLGMCAQTRGGPRQSQDGPKVAQSHKNDSKWCPKSSFVCRFSAILRMLLYLGIHVNPLCWVLLASFLFRHSTHQPCSWTHFCKACEFKHSVAESDRNQTKNIIGVGGMRRRPGNFSKRFQQGKVLETIFLNCPKMSKP